MKRFLRHITYNNSVEIGRVGVYMIFYLDKVEPIVDNVIQYYSSFKFQSNKLFYMKLTFLIQKYILEHTHFEYSTMVVTGKLNIPVTIVIQSK